MTRERCKKALVGLAPETHRELMILAAKKGVPASSLADKAVRNFLRTQKRREFVSGEVATAG